jgi:hypothetical protein
MSSGRLLGARDHDRTSRLPRDAGVAFPQHPVPVIHKNNVLKNRALVGSHHQSLLGPGSAGKKSRASALRQVFRCGSVATQKCNGNNQHKNQQTQQPSSIIAE